MLIVRQFALLGMCAGLAACAHRLVDAETLSDLASVLLQMGVAGVFVGALAIAVRAARRARRPAERRLLGLASFGLVAAGAAFVVAGYADLSISLHELIDAPEPAGSVVALAPDGREIRLDGDLDEGVTRDVAALLAAHPDISRIDLTSEGGLVDEGDALRQLIAAHGLATFVPDYCVSACTLAFLGGRERLLLKGARLGFHAPFEEGLMGEVFKSDSGAERAAYLDAGLPAAFVDRAFAVAPDDLWIPNEADLIGAHVVTGVVKTADSQRMSPSLRKTAAARPALALSVVDGAR